MRYVSIDVETTGLDPAVHQIVEFAAVIDDLADPRPLEELPRFHAFLKPEKESGYVVDPHCLAMHAGLWQEMAEAAKGPRAATNNFSPAHLAYWLRNWLREQGVEPSDPKDGFSPVKVNAAGKNFAGFDARFLARCRGFDGSGSGRVAVRFRRRVLDPAALFTRPGDAEPPDLATCLARAGLEPAVKHRAMDDALDVVRLLRVGILGRAMP